MGVRNYLVARYGLLQGPLDEIVLMVDPIYLHPRFV